MRLILILFMGLFITFTRSAHASEFGAILNGPVGGWLLFACALVGLSMFGALCRQISHYLAERTHASAVTRLMDVLASQADGIAGVLLSHPPAPGDTLQIVRRAAIAQSIAYAKLNLSGTIAQVGATDEVMATRVDNFVAAKLRDAAVAAPVPISPPQISFEGDGSAGSVRDVLAGGPSPGSALPAA